MSRTAVGERLECTSINNKRDCHTVKLGSGISINFRTDAVGMPDATSYLIALTALTIELGMGVALG